MGNLTCEKCNGTGKCTFCDNSHHKCAYCHGKLKVREGIIMNIHITNLKTSKVLNKAGFPQGNEKGFWYEETLGDPRGIICEFMTPRQHDKKFKYYRALTSEEILDVIPKEWNGFKLQMNFEYLDYKKTHGVYHVAYWELGHENEIRGKGFSSRFLAEALAQLWMYIK